ncbi:MAG: VWA domain-containing protein [Bryobacteraceae bacterium]
MSTKMKESVLLLPVCAISLFAGLAVAQTAPATEPGATIRATATEVMLDVVVVDKHGKNVKNLKQGDVAIYEDGVQQPITSFHLAGTRESQTQQSGAGTAPGTSQTSRPLRAVNLICIVFHNIDPISRKNASQAVEQFLGNDLPPDTYVGMFVLSDRLIPILAFTTDRAKVSAAAENAFNLRPIDFAEASVGVLTANPNRMTITTVVGGSGASTTASTTATLTGGEIANTAITGADVTNAPGATAMRGDQVIADRDFANLTGGRSEDEINNMIKMLGALPGRKTVLWVTTGTLTTGDPDKLQAMLSKANASGVTLYPLDITGLTENSTVEAGNLKLNQVASVSASQGTVTTNSDLRKEQSRQGDTMDQAVSGSDTQATLRALAEGTGGFMIANTGDYKKPFSRIVDNVGAHYEVSYRPTSDKYDGSLRKIEVKLLGRAAEYHAESRTGYFAMPDLRGSPGALQPFEIMGLGVLSTTPEPHAFGFNTAAFHFQNEGASSRSELYVELPGGALRAAPAGNQTHQFHASLLALVKDSSGQVVDKYSNDQTYYIPDDKLKAALSVPIEYTHPLDLPAGHYTVETAVLDREAGRASTSVAQFDNPEMKGVGLSSIMVIQRLEAAEKPDAADPLVFMGKHLVPLLEPTLHAGNPYLLYFAVYPDKSNTEKPAAQIEVSSKGKVLASVPAKLIQDTGVWRAVVGAPAQVGSYEVKVTASQGSAPSATQTLSYTVVK